LKDFLERLPFLNLIIIKKIYLAIHLIVNKKRIIGDGGLGIGDWGLGIGDWAQSPIPNPQSPIPNPQSPILFAYFFIYYN